MIVQSFQRPRNFRSTFGKMKVKTKNVINLEHYEFVLKREEAVHSFTVINFKAFLFSSPKVHKATKL
jgi:hypothetical protein